LFLQSRHPLPQLDKSQQSFLIGRHQAFAAFFQASLLSAQFLFALA